MIPGGCKGLEQIQTAPKITESDIESRDEHGADQCQFSRHRGSLPTGGLPTARHLVKPVGLIVQGVTFVNQFGMANVGMKQWGIRHGDRGHS